MPGLVSRTLKRLNAAQVALLSFAAVIALGTGLLMVPAASTGPSLGFIDALFTSTSATCVTGLVVVDTGTRFTFFGQAVILALIQAGGFGIMTISTFILFMAGKRATLSLSEAAAGSFLKLRRYELKQMLFTALVFTAAFEAAGFIALYSRWSLILGAREALWTSLFHSISAFCNAGFSINRDSLMSYAGDWATNLTVMTLIVFGGLGFFVLLDLWETVRRAPDAAKRRLSFHTRIVLSMTVLLIVSGAAVLFLIERGHSLQGLSVGQGMLRAAFQSVTARTAGFNTLDTGRLSNASLFLLVFLMFIGGAPGSTAGGVKVTTAGVILVVVISRLRRRRTPSIFGRSVSRDNLERAVVIILLAAAMISIFTMFLLVTELGGAPHQESRGLFLEILFECVSAFGTVGLSTGITPGLSAAGKIIIASMMFAGRLGPMTLVFAMERRKEQASFSYPEEQVMIG